MADSPTYTAFAGEKRIVSGDLNTMLLQTKEFLDSGSSGPVLIFDDQTGKEVDFDFRGTPGQVLARLASHPLFVASEAPAAPKTGPGRPNLGVVSREVSLLPRHWDWLSSQQGGISVTLRRLVDAERKRTGGMERARAARDAAGKFMWTMAGNQPGFEEASRALYANDQTRLENLIKEWPQDIREHLLRLMAKVEHMEQAAE